MARKGRKLHFQETPTGLPPHEEAVLREAVKQYEYALIAKWNLIREFREATDDNSVSTSFSCKFNHAAKRPIVTGKLSFSRRDSLETEGVVEDPDQTKLPLDDTAGGD